MAKLTADQWAEVMRRHLVGGEKVRVLAQEFGISPNAIRLRRASQGKQAEDMAKQIVATENRLRELPAASQQLAVDLATKLRAISISLIDAATSGAETSARLSKIAAEQSKKVSGENPMETQEELQSIAALTKLANDSASLGVAMMNANKQSGQLSAGQVNVDNRQQGPSATVEEIKQTLEEYGDMV